MAEGNWASGVPYNIAVDTYVWPVFLQGRRDPTSNDIYNPGTRWYNELTGIIYETTGNGGWNQGGGAPASTTSYGSVLLTDNSEPVATKVYVDAIAIAGAPVSTETVAGIGQLATDAEALARTPSTGALALFITPSNLDPILASPSAIGSTTAAAGTFTVLTADGTGAVSLGSSTAGDFTVATGDLSLIGTAGSVVINGGEAVDDAIQLTSAAGGLAVSVAKSAVIASTETNADSVQVTSAGGMDITATGAAGKDIDIVCTSGSVNITGGENAQDSVVISSSVGGIDILATGAAAGEDIDITASSSINLTSTENAANAIYLHANGGGSETITIYSDQGIGADSINLVSDVGGVLIQTGLSGANAIYLHANGGVSETIQIRADQGTGASSIALVSDVGGISVTSGLNSADCIYLHADAGTSEKIRIRADQGTGVDSVSLVSDVGGLTLTGGLGNADAINITTSNVAGGIDIDAGTGGFIVDTTGTISLDATAAANFTTTGPYDLTVRSTTGSIIVDGGEAAVDAVQVNASNAAGGVDIDAGTGGVTLDTTAGFSIDGATASNVTVTGASQDLTLSSVGGSVNVTSTENAANAIYLHANGGASETIELYSQQGTGDSSVYIHSLVGGVNIDAAGRVKMTPATGTVSSPTATVAVNSRVGKATFNGFTTSSGSVQAFTITTTSHTSGDAVLCSITNTGTNDAKMSIERVDTQTAGTIIVSTKNNGTASLNGGVIITFWVLD